MSADVVLEIACGYATVFMPHGQCNRSTVHFPVTTYHHC